MHKKTLITTISISTLLPTFIFPQTAGATTIASAQAKANQIVAQLSLDQGKYDSLSQSYDLSQAKSSQLAAQVSALKAAIAQSQNKVNILRSKLTKQAVASYVTGGSAPEIQVLLESNQSQMSLRQHYLDSISSHEQVTLNKLHQAQTALKKQQKSLQAAQEAQTKNLQQIKTDLQQVQATTLNEQATLSQVKGQIATLVAEQQKQQAQAAAAAQAAALAAAKAKAQAAAQAQLRIQAAAAKAKLVSTSAVSGSSTPPPSSGSSTPPPSSGSSTPPPSSGNGSQAASLAQNQIGKAYVLGDPTSYTDPNPSAFDCSGLTQWVWYHTSGVVIPRVASSQASYVTPISVSQLQPGDLVFYETGGSSTINHVAIYIGGGNVVEANNPQSGVIQASITYDGAPVEYGQVP